MLLTERRIQRRLEATRARLDADKSLKPKNDVDTIIQVNGAEATESKERLVGLPRLETLAERLQLDAFEKRMILLLIGIIRLIGTL